MQHAQQDKNLERAQAPCGSITEARKNQASAMPRVKVNQYAGGLVGGGANFIGVDAPDIELRRGAPQIRERPLHLDVKEATRESDRQHEPTYNRPVEIGGDGYQAERNHQRDRNENDLADRFRQRRDYHRREPDWHRQFVAHLDRHHELAAQLRRWRHIVDGFAADSRREQLEQAEFRRIVLDRDAPSERVRAPRQRLESNRQREAPTDQANVTEHLSGTIVRQEPYVKGDRNDDEECLDAAHRGWVVDSKDRRHSTHSFSHARPAPPKLDIQNVSSRSLLAKRVDSGAS